MRASELLKRLERIEAMLKPDRRRHIGCPIFYDRSGNVSQFWKGPPGTKYFVFPARMSVAEWEQSGAAERQAALVADARADFETAMADQRPDKDLSDLTHKYKGRGQ